MDLVCDKLFQSQYVKIEAARRRHITHVKNLVENPDVGPGYWLDRIMDYEPYQTRGDRQQAVDGFTASGIMSNNDDDVHN